MSTEVVIVDAVRSPIGRRNGALSRTHSADLLAAVLRGLLRRVDLDPAVVQHVIGGCVNQLGMQASNVARTAWLAAGFPLEVPAVTVNTQCGSSQEAITLASGLVAGGIADVVVACGVESLSQIPLGVNVPKEPDYGTPRGGRYTDYFEPTTQFEGAERIAERWNFDRDDLDRYAKRSQDRAGEAWSNGRFAGQLVPIEVSGRAPDGTVGEPAIFARDEGPRATTMEGLRALRPLARQSGRARHTAGSSSQISDGASAALVMSKARADSLGVTSRAVIRSSVLVGTDPVLMLTGPIAATNAVFARAQVTPDDIDLFEVNEAFASVVLAWQSEINPDPERVNPNGGAIALGHPLGASGTLLIAKAVEELERRTGRYAVVTMCCGGGLGTGTLLERAT